MTLLFIIAGPIAIGWLTAGSAMRRSCGLLVAAGMLMIPFQMAGASLFETTAALLLALVCTLRVVDLYKEHPARPALQRIWHVIAIFDTRLATRQPPEVKVRRLFEGLAWFGVVVVAYKITIASTLYPMRWLFAALVIVATFETFIRGIEIVWALVGIKTPVMHDSPYRSRSIREYWGVRWNRIVGGWLREHCYVPLAERDHPRWGVTAAFTVSAVFHWYIALALAGFWWSLPMAAFFLVQGPLIWIEDFLQIRRRSPLIGQAWTLAMLLLASPLLTEPLLQTLKHLR